MKNVYHKSICLNSIHSKHQIPSITNQIRFEISMTDILKIKTMIKMRLGHLTFNH
jgi:hypothetical protein